MIWKEKSQWSHRGSGSKLAFEDVRRHGHRRLLPFSLLNGQHHILVNCHPKGPGSLGANYMPSVPKIKLHRLWSISQEHKHATTLLWQRKAERRRSSLGHRKEAMQAPWRFQPRAWSRLTADRPMLSVFSRSFARREQEGAKITLEQKRKSSSISPPHWCSWRRKIS